jgi:hypothetical protein
MRNFKITAIAFLVFGTAPVMATEIICDGHEDNLNTYLEMTRILLMNVRASEPASITLMNSSVTTAMPVDLERRCVLQRT